MNFKCFLTFMKNTRQPNSVFLSCKGVMELPMCSFLEFSFIFIVHCLKMNSYNGFCNFNVFKDFFKNRIKKQYKVLRFCLTCDQNWLDPSNIYTSLNPLEVIPKHGNKT